jgi:hypothetical protein
MERNNILRDLAESDLESKSPIAVMEGSHKKRENV